MKLNIEICILKNTGRFMVRWDPVKNATHYNIYYVDPGYFKYNNRHLNTTMWKYPPEKVESTSFIFDREDEFTDIEIIIQAFNQNTPVSEPTSQIFDSEISDDSNSVSYNIREIDDKHYFIDSFID